MRPLKRIILSAGLLAMCGSTALGQGATTVQLPTWHFFTVSTTVSVPDSGTGYLGGVNTAATRRARRGLGPALSSVDRTAVGLSASATIIDLDELDRLVLGEAAALRKGTLGPDTKLADRAAFLLRHLARPSDASGAVSSAVSPAAIVPAETLPLETSLRLRERAASDELPPGTSGDFSVEEIRRRNAIAAAERDHEAAAYLEKARVAEESGKANVARIYYQMVARRSTGELKQYAEQRIAALSGKAGPLAASEK